MSNPLLNSKQRRALELLHEPVFVEDFRNWKRREGRFVVEKRRRLYQTMCLTDYCLTYSGAVPDSPTLRRDEAFELVKHAGLVPSFPDSPNVQMWELP